eukprot:SAG31_NODE_453_length_15464_cov_37.074064_21_plen_182_part_00
MYKLKLNLACPPFSGRSGGVLFRLPRAELLQPAELPPKLGGFADQLRPCPHCLPRYTDHCRDGSEPPRGHQPGSRAPPATSYRGGDHRAAVRGARTWAVTLRRNMSATATAPPADEWKGTPGERRLTYGLICGFVLSLKVRCSIVTEGPHLCMQQRSNRPTVGLAMFVGHQGFHPLPGSHT